jgi:Protein of unknown function (DUF1566)
MGERIGNLFRRELMSGGSADRMRARRQFRARLLKSGLGILITIVLGLAITLITSARPTLASMTSTSPASSARMASPSAAGPCGDKAKRYNDCGNGTVTDTVTGLIWLKQANCIATTGWEAAKKAAADLKNGACMLTDGSAPGDWRLPTRAEWEETMKNALAQGCTGPTLTNDEGTACISAGPSSFTGVEADYYWSSTSEGGERAYFGDLDHGHLLQGNLFNTLKVWPVRGGQR